MLPKLQAAAAAKHLLRHGDATGAIIPRARRRTNRAPLCPKAHCALRADGLREPPPLPMSRQRPRTDDPATGCQPREASLLPTLSAEFDVACDPSPPRHSGLDMNAAIDLKLELKDVQPQRSPKRREAKLMSCVRCPGRRRRPDHTEATKAADVRVRSAIVCQELACTTLSYRAAEKATPRSVLRPAAAPGALVPPPALPFRTRREARLRAASMTSAERQSVRSSTAAEQFVVNDVYNIAMRC